MPFRVQGGYTLPEIVTPTRSRCILIYVPDELHYIAQFWGTLYLLENWDNYIRDDQHTGTQVATVWKKVIRDARVRFLKKECCPDAVPPESPPVSGGNGSSAIGGVTGLSVQELEALLTMCITDIRLNGGNLEVKRFGCCDWEPIGEITGQTAEVGVAPTALSAQEALATGIANLGLPTLATATITDPILANNATGSLCVKATALVYQMLQYYADTRDAVAENSTEAGWLFSGLSLALKTTPLAPLAIPVATFNTLTSGTAAAIVAALDLFLADSELHEDMICSVATYLSAASAITGEDIAAFLTWFTDNQLGLDNILIDIINAISPYELAKFAAIATADVGCGCPQMYPYAYTPTQVQGAIFNFTEIVQAPPLANNTPYSYGGLLLNEINKVDTGVALGSGSYQSGWIGTHSSGGLQNKVTGIGLLYQFTEVTDLDSIKFTLTNSQVPVAGAEPLKVHVWRYNATAKWQQVVISEQDYDAEEKVISFGTQIDDFEYLLLGFKFTVDNQPDYRATINQVKLTGSVLGAGFVDKLAGQQL